MKYFIQEWFQAIRPCNRTVTAFSVHSFHTFISNHFGHVHALLIETCLGCSVAEWLAVLQSLWTITAKGQGSNPSHARKKES